MLFEIPYGTLANYSPKGDSEDSVKSRSVRSGVKLGKSNVAKSAVRSLQRPSSAVLHAFLSPDVYLVPVPKSTLIQKGSLWPSLVISEALVEGGLGRSILACLERATPLRKSATAKPEDRPDIFEHYDSLTVTVDLEQPRQITLVDDVLSRGSTVFGCAMRLREAFPGADVRAFARLRTQSFKRNIDRFMEPAVGTIKGYESGKTFRDP